MRTVIKITQLMLLVAIAVLVPLSNFDARLSMLALVFLVIAFLLQFASPRRGADKGSDGGKVADSEQPDRSQWQGSVDVANGAGRLVTAIRMAEHSLRDQFHRVVRALGRRQ